MALIASTEPSVVFTSLAAECVPHLCDECILDIAERENTRYRIAYPPGPGDGALRRLADRAGALPGHRVRLSFAHHADAGETEVGAATDFSGTATFVWHRRPPTMSDRRTVAVLLDLAVHTVARQRNDAAAAAASTKAMHLLAALESSRRIGAAIGILMSRHKITDERAFEWLKQASQHRNRKVRDVAQAVIDTGCLEPVMPSTRPAVRISREPPHHPPTTSPAPTTPTRGTT